jgi:hypothetical protein
MNILRHWDDGEIKITNFYVPSFMNSPVAIHHVLSTEYEKLAYKTEKYSDEEAVCE